jgi:hypothetical protein
MTTVTTPPQQQSIANSITDWWQTLQFAQFDPSLGTLTGVAFGLTGDIDGSILLDNLDRAPASFDVGFGGSLSLLGPDGARLFGVAPSASATTTLAAGAITALTGITGSASAQENYVPSAAPAGTAEAPFVGTGTVPLTVDTALSSVQVTGSGNMAFVAQEAAGASVSLQYGYAPPVNSGGSGESAASFNSVEMIAHTGALMNIIRQAQLPVVTTSPQTFTFADSKTGWNNSAAVSQFDPALGALQSVNISISTDLVGSIAAENLGNSSPTVSTTDTVSLTLDLPGGTPTLAAAASASDSMRLGAFDGAVDYSGASGRIDPLSMPGGLSTTLDSAGDLAAFTGQGETVLPVTATSNATIDGPGNLAAGLLTDAGGTVSISYTYIPLFTGTAGDSASTSGSGYTVTDLGTNRPDTTATSQPYAGGADGPTQELTDSSGDSLAINLTSDNWLIGTDGGNDVIMAHGGNNIFDIAGGSNWLFGAGGDDTFSLRAGASNAWDTIVNFHAGDWLVVWGISAQDSLAWMNGAGAPGYSGLSLDATAADGTVTGATLARYYSTADFSNGRLTTGFGTDSATGANYLYVHANS